MTLYRTTVSAGEGMDFVLSDGSLDRHGTRINPRGWEIGKYLPALFGHAGIPIGKWENVRVDGDRLLGRLAMAAKGTQRAHRRTAQPGRAGHPARRLAWASSRWISASRDRANSITSGRRWSRHRWSPFRAMPMRWRRRGRSTFSEDTLSPGLWRACRKAGESFERRARRDSSEESNQNGTYWTAD